MKTYIVTHYYLGKVSSDLIKAVDHQDAVDRFYLTHNEVILNVRNWRSNKDVT